MTAILKNFGRNRELRPAAYYEPASEAEVLDILRRHRGDSIRVIGRLHSWSDAPGGDGVVLNLKHLNQIQLQSDTSVVVGAGAQVKHVLSTLKRQGRTLLSVGLITEQTLVGAASTGTHGSGRNSLSHAVQSARVARYDSATGEPVIVDIDEGEALRAIRCSLGALGIILSVTVPSRACYGVEEFLKEYRNLDDVLQAETQYPLQQFFLTPWRWRFLAQHRREVPPGRSALAWLYRIHWYLSIDIALHLLIVGTLRTLGSFRVPQFLFRYVIPRSVIYGWKVTDDSASALVMEHELFRHLEMEVFVRRRHLAQALADLKNVLVVAGTRHEPGPMDLTDSERQQLDGLRKRYGHHYPICIRRVLPDDTLISMSEGADEDWYAISLITYARPHQRQGFFSVMEFLAALMARKFGARPHWGKYCPLSPTSLAALYPRFPQFRALCEAADHDGRFRNEWIRHLFGDGRVDRSPGPSS